MREKMSEIIRTINRNIYVGERLERNMRSIMIQNLIIFVLGMVLFVLNLVRGDYITGLSPLGIAIACVVGYCLLQFKRARRGAVLCVVLTLLVVLSYDVLFVPNGFAFLWTLLVPLSVSYFFGLRVGILLSLYFQLLFIFAFYTPYRDHLVNWYTPIVMGRFPLLYFFNAIITLFVMYEYQKSVLSEIDYAEHLRTEVRQQTLVAVQRGSKLERLSEEMVETLARAIDAKDRHTNGHSFRVMRYSFALADPLGWSEQELVALRREALLHDIGKIGVPDLILHKPGRLTEEEYAVIKSHTVVGPQILADLEDMEGVAAVAGCHHERYDGRGYPKGLAGKDIPAHARIVAIADAYDAMHSDRVYRSALSPEAIRSELVREWGRQFDPEYLNVFLALLDEGELDRLAQS